MTVDDKLIKRYNDFVSKNVEKYKFKNFPKHDEEFARFAFFNRASNVYRENHHRYDIIWGVMSDNKPEQAVWLYQRGEISFDEAVAQISKPNSMKQLYVSNQEICDMMVMTNVFEQSGNGMEGGDGK